MFLPQISQELHDLLLSGRATIMEVLSDETAVPSYGFDQLLTEFFNSNAQELFTIALREDVPNQSMKTLELFQARNGALFQYLHQDILNSISEIIFSPDTNFAVVSKFAFLIKNYFAFDFPEEQAPFSFLKNFVSYCHLKSVCLLFESFHDDQKDNPRLTKSLIDHQIIPLMILFIDECPTQLVPDLSRNLANIFNLLTWFNKNNSFSQIISEFSLNLFKSFENPSISLLDAQWRCIAEVISETTIPLLKPQFETLTSFLENFQNDSFYSYQSSAILLIQKLVFNDEEVQNAFIDSQIPDQLGKIVITFPINSTVHNIIAQFLIDSTQFPKLLESFLLVFIPLAANIFNENAKITLRAFAWNLISSLFR